MTSLWLDRGTSCTSDPLPPGPVDDLVVGAGITGLTTGVLLAWAGRRVAIVEARRVGAVATGNTSAKLSLLQGTKYSTLLRHNSRKVVEAYLEANREGQQVASPVLRHPRRPHPDPRRGDLRSRPRVTRNRT